MWNKGWKNSIPTQWSVEQWWLVLCPIIDEQQIYELNRFQHILTSSKLHRHERPWWPISMAMAFYLRFHNRSMHTQSAPHPNFHSDNHQIPIAIYGLLCFPDTPTTTKAWWLSDWEINRAIERIAEEGRMPHGKLDWTAIKRIFKSWQLYVFCIAWRYFLCPSLIFKTKPWVWISSG